MVDLPGSCRTTTCPRYGAVFGARVQGEQGLGGFRRHARGEQVAVLVEDAFGDGRHLINGFAGPVDDLRDALPQASVMVDVGESQVLVGHEAKLGESLFRRRTASGDAVKQFGQLFAVQGIGSSCFRVRVISSITASSGEMCPWSRALTFSAIGISTPYRAASVTAQPAVVTPSATIRNVGQNVG